MAISFPTGSSRNRGSKLETFSVAEVGRLLRFSTPSVYALIRGGKLEAIRIAPWDGTRSTVRVRRVALEKFLRACAKAGGR